MKKTINSILADQHAQYPRCTAIRLDRLALDISSFHNQRTLLERKGEIGKLSACEAKLKSKILEYMRVRKACA